MFEQPFNLAVILGGTRQGRHGTRVGNWFHRLALERDGVEVDLVDLAELRAVEQLAWWALVLRHARTARPYGERRLARA